MRGVSKKRYRCSIKHKASVGFRTGRNGNIPFPLLGGMRRGFRNRENIEKDLQVDNENELDWI